MQDWSKEKLTEYLAKKFGYFFDLRLWLTFLYDNFSRNKMIEGYTHPLRDAPYSHPLLMDTWGLPFRKNWDTEMSSLCEKLGKQTNVLKNLKWETGETFDNCLNQIKQISEEYYREYWGPFFMLHLVYDAPDVMVGGSSIYELMSFEELADYCENCCSLYYFQIELPKVHYFADMLKIDEVAFWISAKANELIGYWTAKVEKDEKDKHRISLSKRKLQAKKEQKKSKVLDIYYHMETERMSLNKLAASIREGYPLNPTPAMNTIKNYLEEHYREKGQTPPWKEDVVKR